jgi:hypothetical protein
MILFVASDCPSDWGWNAEDRFNWTLVSWNTPQAASEDRVRIAHDGARDPMEPHNAVEERTGDGGGHIWVCQGDEVCVLGKAIHHHEDDRFPIHARQPLDETMAISAHTDDGSASGWSSPTGYNCLVLFRWQTTHT